MFLILNVSHFGFWRCHFWGDTTKSWIFNDLYLKGGTGAWHFWDFWSKPNYDFSMWWHNFRFSLEAACHHGMEHTKDCCMLWNSELSNEIVPGGGEGGSVQADGSEHCCFICWTCFYIRNEAPFKLHYCRDKRGLTIKLGVVVLEAPIFAGL